MVSVERGSNHKRPHNYVVTPMTDNPICPDCRTYNGSNELKPTKRKPTNRFPDNMTVMFCPSCQHTFLYDGMLDKLRIDD